MAVPFFLAPTAILVNVFLDEVIILSPFILFNACNNIGLKKQNISILLGIIKQGVQCYDLVSTNYLFFVIIMEMKLFFSY